jgi:hypothetical protein
MIHFCNSKVSKKAVLTISFPCHANWNTLQSLKKCCPILNTEIEDVKALPLSGKHSEVSILLHSLEDHLTSKLCGNAADQMKSKFAYVKSELHHNEFIISIYTIGALGAVRKALDIASKCIAPVYMNPIYKKYCQLLHRKYNSDEFLFAAHTIANECKKIQIAITGPMTLTEDHKKILNEVWSKNFDGTKVPSGKGHPNIDDDTKESHATVKTHNGFETYMIQSYLQTSNVPYMIHNDGLRTNPIDDKLKDNEKIKKFVETKYMKYDDKLHEVLLISCALMGCMSASELSKIPKKPEQSKLVEAIKKNL